ncbi:hypothetical protein [Marinobacterium litorale]|uniref:hypothetical protein n=1 Tax=Marinobacterium litorale TaxID=404770 RepID=UPI000484D35D|nr:hypothetical protein [Marinobacterium litorale]
MGTSSVSNVVSMRSYVFVSVKGQTKLALREGKEYSFDPTCNAINEMLENELVKPEHVRGWIDRYGSV